MFVFIYLALNYIPCTNKCIILIKIIVWPEARFVMWSLINVIKIIWNVLQPVYSVYYSFVGFSVCPKAIICARTRTLLLRLVLFFYYRIYDYEYSFLRMFIFTHVHFYADLFLRLFIFTCFFLRVLIFTCFHIYVCLNFKSGNFYAFVRLLKYTQ